MLFSAPILRFAASLPLLLPLAAASQRHPKRGLCFTPNADYPEDNQVWTQSGSQLSWYYNYGVDPSPAFADLSQEEFEFIPMMWGVNLDNLDDTSFRDRVVRHIEDGRNITRVLGFNEPDIDHSGGSGIPPQDAARAWIANFVPLQKMGIQVGLPAMTGAPAGLDWLHDFLDHCADLLSAENEERTNCTYDFLPVHWYDNFEGLASHIGERVAQCARPHSPSLFCFPCTFIAPIIFSSLLTLVAIQLPQHFHLGHRICLRPSRPRPDPAVLQHLTRVPGPPRRDWRLHLFRRLPLSREQRRTQRPFPEQRRRADRYWRLVPGLGCGWG